MLRHILVLASCLVLHQGLATGRQAAGDPISGLWGSRQGAGLDLKFDARVDGLKLPDSIGGAGPAQDVR